MNFDAIAPWYETLERMAFGDDLQRCRVACLEEIDPPQRALVVGEGNGRFLCELLRRYPEVEVDCLDASQRMLHLARQRIEAELPNLVERIRFLHRDVTSWSPPEHHYDLLVTHFFLDCFPESQLAGIVRKLAESAANNANWLLSDFCIPPEKGSERLRARCWLAAMYFFFRLTTRIEASELIDSTPFLPAEGFQLMRQHLFRNGLLKSELWKRGAQAISDLATSD